MDENKARAKHIFLQYAGDPYQMEREGKLDSYRNLGATSAEERAWAQECERNLIDHFCQVGVVDSQVVTLMKLVKSFESYTELLAFLSEIEIRDKAMDTFTRIRLSEEILDVSSSLEKERNPDKNTLRQAREVAFELVRLAQNDPITVDPYYRTVPHLPEMLEENRLRQRIRKLARQIH